MCDANGGKNSALLNRYTYIDQWHLSAYTVKTWTRTCLSRMWAPQSHPIISKELNSRGSSRKSSVRLDYRPESSRGRSKRSLEWSMRRPWADTTRARYRGGIARASTSGISRIPGRINKVRASLARFRHATLIAGGRGEGSFLFSFLYMSDDRATFSGCFALKVNHNNRLEIRTQPTHPPRGRSRMFPVREVAQEFWELEI